jgi:hypothetical protein
VRIGKIGRKNCRVMGKISAVIRRAAAAVLTTGPGDSAMHNEKMARMARIRYCPSKYDHR